ncbi:hypothetical protein GOBAR_DD22548 [Gossypium barbadense]|nr:hypothetical protein GOBAR_DD22548 [Gossypium barbadense]
MAKLEERMERMMEMMFTMVKGKTGVGEGSGSLDIPIPFHSDTGSLQRRKVEEITTPLERLFDILRKSNLIHVEPPRSLEIREGVKINEINTLDGKPVTTVYGKKTSIEKNSTLKVVQDDVLVIRVPGPFKDPGVEVHSLFIASRDPGAKDRIGSDKIRLIAMMARELALMAEVES